MSFHADELFFSITDYNSIILSGNDVFIRVSGYTKKEVLGRYHNIVRHPHMPKIIFKYFWDVIQAKKPIIAYVKNRAKNGDYYWVLAAVFPLDGCYISIRIKPSTKLFSAVQEFYGELLEAESRGGIEKSEALLTPFLKNLGYADYEAFMSDAFLSELKAHKKVQLIAKSTTSLKQTQFTQCLEKLRSYTSLLMERYDVWFEKIDLFKEIKTMFEQQSFVLRKIASEIVFLSLNASVTSYKTLDGGETFSVLARDVRTNAKENNELIVKIDTVVRSLSVSLNELIFSVCSIRLQSELLNYFIDELLCESCSSERAETEHNMGTLVTLVMEYAKKTSALREIIEKQMQGVLGFLVQLEQQMMYLGYIQMYGVIESAGKTDKSVDFGGIFVQLKTHIQKTSDALCLMQNNTDSFATQNNILKNESSMIEHLLDSLNECIHAMKQT